jgi:hypothetical protein
MKNSRVDASGTLPLQVENTGFLLDRLGEDCHPLQFLRELTQNAIEAIQRTSKRTGQVVWDVDWTSLDLSAPGVLKLCVTDNGDGMTGDELERYINQLSSSLQKQSIGGNYGVGAKIAAATRNHHGLIYLSWKNSEGSMIHLWRDPSSGQYGLRQIERPDGTYGHHASVEDAIKPDLVGEHGTRIVLYGNTPDQDTMQAPEGAPNKSRWIAKYLNSRYFRFPDGITVTAREGWQFPRSDSDHNKLRTVTGQATYLQSHAQVRGVVKLSSALAHWWILEDSPALTADTGFIESSGHMAALYSNELYESVNGRSGTARLQNFGVILGHRRVVIYVEPEHTDDSRVTTTTSRTQLMINNQPLPWADWAAEFRDKLPQEINALISEVAAGTTAGDVSQAIRDRLKDILDLYKVTRYRPAPSGDLAIDETRRGGGGRSFMREDSQTPSGGSRSGNEGGAAGGVYSVFLKRDGDPGKRVRPDVFPEIIWVSDKDGSRDPGDIEDRAARFLLEQNKLLINADFRVFNDMIDHWTSEYDDKPGVRDSVTESVQAWFAQALVETVIGVQALKDSKEWPATHIDAALSEEALTAAVMSRYHVNNQVKRELGSRLGRLSVA